MTPDRTTVCRLTSSAPAAIAVIEVHGARAMELVQRHWAPKQGTSHLADHRIRYGMFRSMPGDMSSTGESIVVVRRGPDRIELHCHGGQVAASSILRALTDAGANEIGFQEWIAREVYGRTAAEATEDLLRATTLRTASILMDQVRGALDQACGEIERLRSQGHFDEASHRAAAILRWGDVGLHLIHPYQVVLCGPPNVGKSSLLNRMLGYSRAVVHAEAGTTRDLLAETTSIEGWPVTLFDSAGIRESEHNIEIQGIERARQAIATADRLLLLIDPVQGWTTEHESIWQSHKSKCLLVQTKSDTSHEISTTSSLPAVAFPVSSVSGSGIDRFMNALVHSLIPEFPPAGVAVPFRSSHIDRLVSWLRP
jgi:tRNA modification GTPase